MTIVDQKPNEQSTISSNIFFLQYKTQMDTKHKVILVVFSAFFAVVFLIYLLGGNRKVENFEEEDFEDDDDTETEKKKEPIRKKSKSEETKEIKETKETSKTKTNEETKTNQPMDYMKEAMNYLNSLSLPFQVKKEVFTELFSEEGMSKLEKLTTLPDVKKFVANIVDMTGTTLQTPSSTTEKFGDEPISTPLSTGLEEVKNKINNLSQSLSSVVATIEKFEKETHSLPSTPKFLPAKPTSTSNDTSKTTHTIEGFENVRHHFASF